MVSDEQKVAPSSGLGHFRCYVYAIYLYTELCMVLQRSDAAISQCHFFFLFQNGRVSDLCIKVLENEALLAARPNPPPGEIGRASCRERVYVLV